MVNVVASLVLLQLFRKASHQIIMYLAEGYVTYATSCFLLTKRTVYYSEAIYPDDGGKRFIEVRTRLKLAISSGHIPSELYNK